jgi:hypothetical protein
MQSWKNTQHCSHKGFIRVSYICMKDYLFRQVNESERERTLSELEHRRTSQSYHRAEMRVQQLQKELKRAIAKSR